MTSFSPFPVNLSLFRNHGVTFQSGLLLAGFSDDMLPGGEIHPDTTDRQGDHDGVFHSLLN